jgi:L-lactate dehydrogenase complex protein LldF
MTMQLMASIFDDPQRYEQAQALGRLGQWPLVHGGSISWLPGKLSGWTAMRDLRPLPAQTFRQWWRSRQEAEDGDRP